MKDYSAIFLRLALGISFLAAVADRFGLWGSFGQPNVAWGDFSHFVAYTRKLNWFMPSAAIPALAWAATCVSTRGRQIVVANADHGIADEAPDVVIDAVRSVVDQISTEGRR